MFPQQLYINSNCIFCGKCISVCPQNAISLAESGRTVNQDQCIMCGKCVDTCISDALRIKGKYVYVEELVGELRKDADYYALSGGGITLSGGEALLQPHFCKNLLQACQEEGWDTAVETTANVPWKNIASVLPNINHVLLDIKHADSKKHKQYTSAPNERIIDNACKLASVKGLDLVIRIPLIPGFNDSDEEIRDIARIVASLQNVSALHLLPYHRLGENKYKYLGMTYTMTDAVPQTKERVIHLRDIAATELHIPCLIGG